MNATNLDKNYLEFDNQKGMRLIISKLGASIYAIYIDGKIMTLTPACIQDFEKKTRYYGKNIGPIANRIKDGKLFLNNNVILFDKNEGENTLHSGSSSISNMMFEITKDRLSKRYRFITLKTKGKNLPGLKGNITYKITYKIHNNKNIIELIYDVKPSEDSILSLTNHSYFCLGDNSLENMKLMIKSSKYIHPNKDDLTYVEKRDIIPCLDFNKKKRILRDINDPYLFNSRTFGYDHCFILDSSLITLENKNYKLEITSDFKAIQIYSDNYDDNIKLLNSDLKVRRGIAIEPMDDPFNRDIISKNTHYKRCIRYKFSKKTFR